MHKYTLRKKYKKFALSFAQIMTHTDKEAGHYSNKGMHSQGPCEISHLHNSLAYTEVSEQGSTGRKKSKHFAV